MNTQETQQLIRFLNGIVQTAPPTIDSQAQALIDQAFAKQPHAAYLLTQRCLALSIAVEAAQRRITQLEGNANGLAGANQWGQQPALSVGAAASTSKASARSICWPDAAAKLVVSRIDG